MSLESIRRDRDPDPRNRDLVFTRELPTADETLEYQVARSSAGQVPGRGDPAVQIRALSITQPWATLIAIGQKRVETRSWGTSYRGPIAIHAAKTFPGGARDLCVPGPGFARSPLYDALRAAGIRGPIRDRRRCSTGDLPLGAVLAIAELVDVRRITSPEALGHVLGANEVAFGAWTPGRYAWLLAYVRPLAEPIPARGAQGLWRWAPPADLAFASRSPA